MVVNVPDQPQVGDPGHTTDTGQIIEAIKDLDARKAETIGIGTVFTGEPGSSAAANMHAGPNGTYTIDLYIPKGEPGPPGTGTSEPGSGAVESVNSKTGAVVLNAGDVGADPAGSATSAVSGHVGAADPHSQYLKPGELVSGANMNIVENPDGSVTLSASTTTIAAVSSVNGLTGDVNLGSTDVGADPAGAGAAAVTAHVATADPHVQYARADGTRGQFATTTQGAKADTAVQPSALAPVATAGTYASLTGKPTLGTAADNNETDFEPAGVTAAHVANPTAHPQYQTQTVADARYVMTAVINAKGDLVIGSADNTVAVLPLGEDGEALIADSTLPAGMRWGTTTPPPPVLTPTTPHVWGYVPTIVHHAEDVLPTPLPSIGMVVEAPTLSGPATWDVVPLVMLEPDGAIPVPAPDIGLVVERPTTPQGGWGYTPVLVIEEGDAITLPVPTFGLVIERP